MRNKSFLAFALLQVTIPAISVIFFAANPLWIIGSLVFTVATLRSLHAHSSAYVTAVLCIVSGVAFALNLLLGTSYYMQGEGFNDAFFYHLNSGALVIAARSYGGVFYPSVASLLIAFWAPAIIRKTNPRRLLPSIPASLLWVLALATSYPVYALISYQASLPAISSGSHPVSLAAPGEVSVIPRQVPVHPIETAVGSTTRVKKNIVFIYAESLEQLYFDKALFGDLLPNIREISADAHRFTNLRQVRGTGWTIAGIVASQCGFPLNVSNHLASNSTIASVDRPYADEICLADILSGQGYATVYMGGAPLWFAGKGKFLKTHGYQRVLGDEELLPMLPDSLYRSGWGLYDDSLFKLALQEIRSLENSGQPYLFTLLTLDTHHPNGIPSNSCGKLADNQDPMSNAIYCSDQLISQFIAGVKRIVDMQQTIIVLFSDHLALRNTLWKRLRANQQRRRLTLMIFDQAAGSESDTPGTHFDVAPTLLEAAGITGYVGVGVGVGLSLFSQRADKPSSRQLSQAAESGPNLLNRSFSAGKSGVDISLSDLSLRIGGLTLKANAAGKKFVSGMYLAVFDEEGKVVDAIYSDDYQNLAKNLDGSFVVGISILSSRPDEASYFFGRISPDGKGITQRPLNRDTHLSADEFLKNM